MPVQGDAGAGIPGPHHFQGEKLESISLGKTVWRATLFLMAAALALYCYWFPVVEPSDIATDNAVARQAIRWHAPNPYDEDWVFNQ